MQRSVVWSFALAALPMPVHSASIHFQGQIPEYRVTCDQDVVIVSFASGVVFAPEGNSRVVPIANRVKVQFAGSPRCLVWRNEADRSLTLAETAQGSIAGDLKGDEQPTAPGGAPAVAPKSAANAAAG